MKIAVLEICPFEPSQHHINLFFNKEKEGWHFFYVSHFQPNTDFPTEYFSQKEINNKHFLGNYPNTNWAFTRNILFKKINKTKFDYFFFIDYDAHLSFNHTNKKTNHSKIRDEFIHYLTKYQPPIAMPYYADDIPKLNNINLHECSAMPFTNNIVKIIHKSLIQWFLPYLSIFTGSYDACHFFNILELPFKKWICCIHSIIVKNQTHNAIHFKNNQLHKNFMQTTYSQFKNSLINQNPPENALDLKKIHHTSILETELNKNWMGEATDILIKSYFDLEHEFFKKRQDWEKY